MNILTIAFNDLRRSFRNASAIGFMFIMPLLTTGVFFIAFGGASGGGDSFDLAVTQVIVVNQDRPSAQFGSTAAGRLLVDFLQNESLSELLQVEESADEAAARAAVDNQEAGVAVIIPADFTNRMLTEEGVTTVTLYQDPNLTIGPGIVKEMVSQLIDGYAGTKIAADVVSRQLALHDTAVNSTQLVETTNRYAASLQLLSQSLTTGEQALLAIEQLPGNEDINDQPTQLVASIMVAMMIFYAFFTGANSAQSILKEQEEGTLARMFTSPASRATILGGKFVSVFLTLIVQVTVLVIVSSLIFKISWADMGALALAMLGLVVSASGFGLLLISFVRDTRQAGPVMGGVVTISGMVGGLMTSTMPNMPEAFKTANLMTPQGWVLQSWTMVLAGGNAGDIALSALVAVSMGVIFFIASVAAFKRRFS